MASRGGVRPGQGGAEGTDERVLSLHTDAREMVGVTSVEEGHDDECDVAEEMMSAVAKLAKEICESCDIGQPTAACHFKWPSRSRWSRRHRGACLGGDVVCYGMVSLMMSSRDKLWRTMLSCLSRPREGWLHGEVDAFDSHEQGLSGLRKSQIVAAPT